jgi:hypothetical protein
MSLIVKGQMTVKTVESNSPSVGSYKWDPELKRIVKVEEPKKITQPVKEPKNIQVIHKQVVQKETVEPPSHYHHETHGELEKLINTKSDYLKDMLDFENNK